MTKLLIDLDVIAYRAAFATEKTKFCVTVGNEFSERDSAAEAKVLLASGYEHIWTRKEVQPVDQALMIASVMVSDIKARYEAENPVVLGYLTGIANYRHSIATRANYKGNRAGTPAPVHLKAIRQHLITTYNTTVSAGEEADDLLGIAMSVYPGAVCCSIDKDLLQLPGRHFDFIKKEEVTISAKEGWLNFYSQVLSGDSTDNVLGVTGLGPVKSRKALEGCKNSRACWLKCVELYTAEFGPELGPKYALETARLVYVRRTVGDMFNAPSATKELQAA